MNKECQYILQPAPTGKLYFNETHEVLTTENIKGKAQPSHDSISIAYILSDDPLMLGNWAKSPTGNIHQVNGDHMPKQCRENKCVKIIASTDFLLTKPKSEFSSSCEHVPNISIEGMKHIVHLHNADLKWQKTEKALREYDEKTLWNAFGFLDKYEA